MTTNEDIIDVNFEDWISESTTEREENSQLAGGFTVYSDETSSSLNEDLLSMFSQATSSITGIVYTPIALIGTQVVAGLNYSFFCKGAPVVPQPTTAYYIVTVYRDLQGHATVTNIADYRIDPWKNEEMFPSKGPEQLCGGWTVYGDNGVLNMPLDFQRAFDMAMEKWEGKSTFHPNLCLGTQVVAGTNYAMLATERLSEDSVLVGLLTVYQSFDGNSEFLSFVPINPGEYR